jgi:excinuclease UvrABC nuclease subunit
MPFVQQIPREFNRINIEAIKPGLSGVYGLFKTNQWIYVGKGDLRARLLAHLNGDNPLISSMRPTHYVDEFFPGDPSLREKQLIVELSPACNQKVG